MTPSIDATLVHRLIAEQFPAWANLPIEPVVPGGWDNRTFRLGDAMLVRLPSAAGYAAQVAKEQRWLPALAPHLPLPIPVPLAKGEPGAGYPWSWSVYRWLEGQPTTLDRIADLDRFAMALGDFIAALHRIDAGEGPPAGQHNFHRGGALAVYDTETRAALAALDGRIDTDTCEAIWAEALASAWRRPPVWVHGDMAAGNLLIRDGTLAAVIDFGSSAVGDPACDLVIAWTLFHGSSRAGFRAALPLDGDTWRRARGWALWKALITVAGHEANQREVETSRRVIGALLAERGT